MKTNGLIMLLSLVLFTNCFAQRENKRGKKDKVASPKEQTTPAAEPEEISVITEECLLNISLFNESAKNKQFADALGPWNAAYKQCPSANKAIYSRGREIVQWELSQTKDEASYQKVFNKLMGMYDKRIKYFGDDPVTPTPWILGVKAIDYIQFVKNDTLKKQAYAWLETSIDGMGERSEIDVIRLFIILSDAIYKADSTHAEKYIADFTKASTVLDKIIAQPALRTNAAAVQLKPALEQVFAASGAADCNTLDKLFKAKVYANLTNQNELNNILNLYKRVRCIESDVFFTAAEASHKLQPTAESAAALASISFRKEDFANAIAFNDEATKLSTSNDEKAEFQFTNAQIVYSKLNNMPRAREYARNSIEFKPANGKAYMLIGTMYANTRGISSKPILNKTVFWAAVDKILRARQVDPSVTEDANRLIAVYSRQFPSKEDIFFEPELAGKSTYFVGGWIGESTSVR